MNTKPTAFAMRYAPWVLILSKKWRCSPIVDCIFCAPWHAGSGNAEGEDGGNSEIGDQHKQQKPTICSSSINGAPEFPARATYILRAREHER